MGRITRRMLVGPIAIAIWCGGGAMIAHFLIHDEGVETLFGIAMGMLAAIVALKLF